MSRGRTHRGVAGAVSGAAPPGRRRIWSLPDPGAFGGLRDLALAAGPEASRTLYGTELPARAIRSRMLAPPRIVAVSDPAGQPLDTVPGEVVKRRTLATRFEACGTWNVRGARVTVYVRHGPCRPPASTPASLPRTPSAP